MRNKNKIEIYYTFDRKTAFESFFKQFIEPTISKTDKPALRQMWNDLIDGMCKNGELPERARNWSHPKRFYWSKTRKK